MNIEYWAMVVLGLAFLIEKAGSFVFQRNAARERRELYSRIQAGTLTDYAVNRAKAEAASPGVRGQGSGVGEVIRSVEDLTAYRDELPEEAFVEAQAGFNSLMG